MKKYKKFVPQLKEEIYLWFEETWQTGISTLKDENCIILSSGLDPNHIKSRRGEREVGILLNGNAATAWKSAAPIARNDLRARTISARLLVNDNMKNEV